MLRMLWHYSMWRKHNIGQNTSPSPSLILFRWGRFTEWLSPWAEGPHLRHDEVELPLFPPEHRFSGRMRRAVRVGDLLSPIKA